MKIRIDNRFKRDLKKIRDKKTVLKIEKALKTLASELSQISFVV